jgi:hypothetical protein
LETVSDQGGRGRRARMSGPESESRCWSAPARPAGVPGSNGRRSDWITGDCTWCPTTSEARIGLAAQDLHRQDRQPEAHGSRTMRTAEAASR